MNFEEAKAKLLQNPEIRRAYENPPLRHRLVWWYARLRAKFTRRDR